MKQLITIFVLCLLASLSLAYEEERALQRRRKRRQRRGITTGAPTEGPIPSPTSAPTNGVATACGGAQASGPTATPTNLVTGAPTDAAVSRRRRKRGRRPVSFGPAPGPAPANDGRRRKKRNRNRNVVVQTTPTSPPTSRPTDATAVQDLCPDPEIDPLLLDCPPLEAGPMPLPSNYTGGVFVELSPNNRGLCTLWRVGSSAQERTPVARSYNNNPWELYGNTLADELEFDCDETTCILQLPYLDGESSYFEMMAVDYEAESSDALKARFLEQATFGPTQEAIDSLASTSFAEWISDQMTMDYFSHRAYYRRRLNSRTMKPTNQGVATRPCVAGAMYRQYAFSDRDRLQDVEIRTDPATGFKVLLMNDQARTVLNETSLRIGVDNPVPDGSYEICRGLTPNLESSFQLKLPNGACASLYTSNNEEILNPRVYFTEQIPPTNSWVNLQGKVEVASPAFFPDGEDNQELLLTADLSDVVCNLVPDVIGWPSFEVAGKFNGQWYLFDPRWDMYENTVSRPVQDGGGLIKETTARAVTDRFAESTQCGNAELNFLNEQGCYLSDNPSVCSVVSDDDVDDTTVQARVPLTRNLLANVYSRSDKLFYAVKDLRQDEGVPYGSPCTPSTRSRWARVRDRECSKGAPGPITVETFVNLLSGTDVSNPDLRDVFTPAIGTKCDAADLTKFDFQVELEGQCWENVHQDYMQVFDFTRWLDVHRGGRAALLQFAERSDTNTFAPFVLSFPASHEMERWHVTGKPFRDNIGRFGDTVQLLVPLRTVEVVGGEIVVPPKSSIQSSGVVCGSPNEVSNDPSLPGIVGQGVFDVATRRDQTTPESALRFQKAQVWMRAAMFAPDQLRQKVAWALAQLLVITPDAVSANEEAMTETFLAYYDIFVRNAFSNYRNILKEVIYSPLMGEMLTYVGSRSTSFVWQTEKRLEFADENFAREVMQLFSIGLYKLEEDGTVELSESGDKQFTYTNNEISEYARLYTGFNPVQSRGNMENALRDKTLNPIDPMGINVAEHDQFPKLGLDGQYIGDGLPLCRDLPARHFLMQGAKYKLLGRNDIPKLLGESPFWLLNPAIERLQLNPLSDLFAALCNQQSNGKCNFKGSVELRAAVPCDGPFCEIESPRIIEVSDGVFYEYVQPPCARLAFPENTALMQTAKNRYYCESRDLQEGSVSCCGADSTLSPSVAGTIFDGERVSYGKAMNRCLNKNLSVCSSFPDGCELEKTCDYSTGQWTSGSCDIKVKIDLEGRVAIVHSIDPSIGQNFVDVSVGEASKGFFRVVWNPAVNNLLSNYEATCDSLGCARDQSDNFCFCDTSVMEEIGFTEVPSVDDVLSLTFGAAENALQGLVKTRIAEGLFMYTGGNGITKDTIFEIVDDNNVTYLRKNLVSEVTVGTTAELELKFRNPLHMMSFVSPELRDIQYEVDAAIDHYMYHPNTGPFLAARFAKRFGLSNPSPRFVEAMSTSFQKGKCEVDGVSFGSGEYGDLMAMIACLLLDREARSEVLDVDASSGSVLEPLLKLVRVLRSLEYEGDPDRPLFDFLNDLQPRIGQMPYQMLTVFSFFLPGFQPGGSLTTAGLACPECQELTAPSSISLMNGLLSLMKYGLEAVGGGFARGRSRFRSVNRAVLGSDEFASGSLKFRPNDPEDAATVIQRLSVLLTAGRLSKDKKDLLTTVYQESLQQGRIDEALINTMQLIATTPEFHTNTISDNSGGPREQPEDPVASEKKYKAVVYLILEGGFDSYNMLVPDRCPRTDIVEQYNNERGKIALTAEERNLKIAASGQPCDRFAIHPDFPLAKQLYDSGDLSFIANAGVMTTTDLDKRNYVSQSPFQLFSHNDMQREAKVLDGFDESAGTGVMGRIASVLTERDYVVNSIAIDGPSVALQSDSALATPEPIILSRFGPEAYGPQSRTETLDIRQLSTILNGQSGNHSSLFGEQWSETFSNAILLSDKFKAQLEGTTLGNQWPTSDASQITKRLETVSKLVKTKEQRGVDRDFFYVSLGGWDHHRNLKAEQEKKFTELNEALEFFVQEMKDQGRFDEVSVVVTSDFGRTLTPNSGGGSDHAWAGNYLLFGGGVKGKQIHGSFPTDITPDGEFNIGRGRLIPTTSWDCVWNGISQWLGVETGEELDYVLPNRASSSGEPGGKFTPLLTRDELFVQDRLRRRLS